MTVDVLDSLFRRLVLAAHAADALARPLEVGELLDRFVPYGAARRDGLLDTNEDYLHAMMRLVSGEGGYVFGDDLLQDDLKAELASPNPDLTALRSYANTRIRLATARAEAVLAGDTAIDLRPPTPVEPAPAVAPRATAARTPLAATGAATPLPGGAATPADPVTQPRAAAATFQPDRASVMTGTVHPGCPYCAQPLPDGRPIKFCPSCGLNLLVRRCPGCSAEIESGWKYCVTCGRAAS